MLNNKKNSLLFIYFVIFLHFKITFYMYVLLLLYFLLLLKCSLWHSDGISYCQTLLFSFWYEVKGLQTFFIPCSNQQTTFEIREKNDSVLTIVHIQFPDIST